MTLTVRSRIWPSPLSAAMLTVGAAGPGEVRSSGDAVYWSERRPDEGGRVQLLRRTPDGSIHEVLGDGASARTRVHEYGSGAWAVADGVVAFVDDARDGRMFVLEPTDRGAVERPLSPAAAVGAAPYPVRYADLTIDVSADRVFAVRERHSEAGTVTNDIVELPLDGTAVESSDSVRVIADGADFYAQLALDADGTHLAYIRWMLPDMAWDATELVVVDLASGHETIVAGGPGESVVEPLFGSDGTLTFCSDRTGWWNPYRHDLASPGMPGALAPVDGEIGGPLWVFGNRSVAWLNDGRLVASVSRDGTDHLVVAAGDGTPPTPLDVGFTHIPQVVAGPDDSVLVVAGTPQDESEVWQVHIAAGPSGDGGAPNATVTRLRDARDLGIGPEWFSRPESMTIAVDKDTVTHAVIYPPTNPEVTGPAAAALPPLLVLSHGGPTSAARVQLSLTVQFWTSRGFCVADVNYRGSTGYGREYREALNGAWGVADVADCAAVAAHLANAGVVDPARLGIRGGSAGGFTTLAALCFTDTFTAGVSAYGIADLEILARDTHKFESRYLDRLVGPWPAERETYEARSPIHHLDRLSCPVGILQGAEDAVVPPAQADAIVAVLRGKGLPYAALTFADEGHGFRRGENIIRALEAELWFFARAFDLDLDEPIEPVPGEGL